MKKSSWTGPWILGINVVDCISGLFSSDAGPDPGDVQQRISAAHGRRRSAEPCSRALVIIPWLCELKYERDKRICFFLTSTRPFSIINTVGIHESMKVKTLLIAILSLSILLGCSSPKIDTSSDETMKASIEKVRQSLPKEKKEQFDEALKILAFNQTTKALNETK